MDFGSYLKSFFLGIVMLPLCVLGQDYSKLIPERDFTQYLLPDSTTTATSFNMVGDIQVSVPMHQGIYNANLGIWTVLPGSDIMSYCKVGDKDYYLHANPSATKLKLFYLEQDSLLTEVGIIDFGNFRIKKIIGSENVLIYGSDGNNHKIYKSNEDTISLMASHDKPIYDLVATVDQVLFVSEESIYMLNNDSIITEVKDFGILLTGISYGPKKSYFISTILGVFNFDSLSDKKPELITKVLNGVVHYQSDYLFLLDYITNSIFRIKY